MATSFPDGFLWGASTAAYQIEGAVREDGRGPSIWDAFCRLPGTIANGDTGDIACDHYHRWPEDVALMRELGLGAYRLSTAWPRILPEGRGMPNLKGLEFYDRLIDGILDAGIEPWVCLYHWDLPQALEYRGGWQNRDTASWFAEYAQLAVRRLGDRVKHWATFNEPNCACVKGYGDGGHAPGIRGRLSALTAIHVMNLAHGRGVEAMRAERADLLLGNIFNFHPYEPASDHEEDEIATMMLDALWNRSFPDPQMLGHYPEPLAAEMAEPLVQAGDLEVIRQKLDYFAFNHYTRSRVRRDPDHPFEAGTLPPPDSVPVTDMGWEIAPDAFRAVMIEVKERYSRRSADLHPRKRRRFPRPGRSRRAYPRREAHRLSARLSRRGAGRNRGRRAGEGLFCVVPARQFRMDVRLRQALRRRPCRLRVPAAPPKDLFNFYAELADGAPLDRE